MDYQTARPGGARGRPRVLSAGNGRMPPPLPYVVLGSSAPALPDRIPAASAGSMSNITIGGFDRARGRPYAYYETIAGGAGGGPTRPGRSAVQTHMTNTMNTPIEALPLAYPFPLARYEVRRGSGGDGRHPGGDDIVREYLFPDRAAVPRRTASGPEAPRALAGAPAGPPGRLIRESPSILASTTHSLGWASRCLRMAIRVCPPAR